jgi:hypothetical protein
VNRTAVEPVTTLVATSADPDPEAAAAAILEQLGTDHPLYLLFVTADYPLEALATRLGTVWGERLIGCTSAGNIGPAGFGSAPVLAMAFRGGDLSARTVVIEPLSDLGGALERARPELEDLLRSQSSGEAFALLLVDGLSLVEEHLTAALKSLLGGISLIGGSAGDNLSFTGTSVLAGGEFGSDRATLTIISTASPFQVFRLHHYEPQDTVLVITSASPERRLVHEINGIPAAQALAELLDVTIAELGPEVFSSHPLVMRAGGETWVRSVSRPLPDGSLQFFAAIETGAVLRPGRPGDAVALLRHRLESIEAGLGGRITGLFTFDCILRRIELRRAGLDEEIGQVLSRYPVGGFSTYGEQFDDFHMNQTMVGVAFGGPASVGEA